MIRLIGPVGAGLRGIDARAFRRLGVIVHAHHAFHAEHLGHGHLRADDGHVGVLLVGDGKRGAADATGAVELELVVHETDVEGALVGVQPGILHGEHPRHLVGLVVVRVPPPGGRDEDAPRRPVASNGIHDVAVGVDLLAHQRVHSGLGRHGEVQRDRVVAVRALHVLGRDGVEQRPQHVGQRLGLRARLVAQQDAEAVALRAVLRGRVFDLLHGGEQIRAFVQRGLELLHAGFAPDVIHQRLIVDPIDGGAALIAGDARVFHRTFGDGNDEHVALAPRDVPVFAARHAASADHVERLRGRGGFRVEGVADLHAEEGRHEIRRRALRVDLEVVVDVEGDDASGAGLVKTGGVHQDGNGGHLGVGRRAVLVHVAAGGPFGFGVGLQRGGGRGKGG